uniref:Uncharacterized protein n=1 Tax=Oryza glumipatula TaxID=40148 RepID=A0A0E0A8F2_9ORYZ
MPAGGGGGSSGPPGTIANKVPLALFDSSPRAPMAGKRAAYALRPGTRSSCSGRLFPLAALAGLAAMHYSNHRLNPAAYVTMATIMAISKRSKASMARNG